MRSYFERAAIALLFSACATYSQQQKHCNLASCDSVAACTASAQVRMDAGDNLGAQCYFQAALSRDANSDEARLGYAFTLLLAGLPNAAAPQFEQVKAHTRNDELRSTAAGYLELLQRKIPVAVLFRDPEGCDDMFSKSNGVIAGKNMYRLIAHLGLFSVPAQEPVHVFPEWKCCEETTGAALAVVLNTRCDGVREENHDLTTANGQVVVRNRTRRYRGSVTIELYDTATSTLINRFSGSAETLEFLGDTSYLSWGKAEDALIFDIVRTVLAQPQETASASSALPGRSMPATERPHDVETFGVKCSFAGEFGDFYHYFILNDGGLTINDTNVTLALRTINGDFGFSVPSAKIIDVNYQEAGALFTVPWENHRVSDHAEELHLRVLVSVMDRHMKYREAHRDYYLYNAGAVTVGVRSDGSISVGGISHVSCDKCDASLRYAYKALQRARGK
jgi:hypothetical protein